MIVRFKTITPGKKIQAIKVLRGLTGWSLKDSKLYVDNMGTHGTIPGKEFSVSEQLNWEDLFQEAVELGVVLEQVKELVPLSIDRLALKLALHEFRPAQVESLADALTGIEDAEGSLRAAAKAMREVQ